MASIHNNYKTYVLGTDLDQQLEPLSNPTRGEVNLSEVIDGAYLQISSVDFKPISINGKLFSFSLDGVTGSKNPEETTNFFYEKYTFTIKKTETDEVIYKDISTENIEDLVAKIYHETKSTS
jgi:hypothetical protein